MEENRTIEEFIDSLNLPFAGEMRESQYIINVETSDDFSKIFSAVSMNDKLHLDGKSEASVNKSNFRFTDGYYDVLLQANYNNDSYSCTIEER